jgi:PTS system nitrogen regulatory IIA component
MGSSVSLAELVRRGGVYYNISGSSPVEALKEAVRAVSLPKALDRDELLTAILEREALMPTALGNGIAIPHPRSPMLTDKSQQRVAAIFLKTPVPYNALDRKPVSTFFLILSADAKSHLSILASISYLCQRSEFLDLLAKRPSTEEMVAHIAVEEAAWAARER